MTVPRKLHRGAWKAAAAAVATLAVVVTPTAAADQPGILVTDHFSGKARTSVTHTLGTPGVPLLQSFFYKYSNQDQHLETVGSLPGNGNSLVITYTDDGNNHEFSYDVAYHRVSETGIVLGSVHDVCDGGVCEKALAPPVGDFVFVITGFRLSFNNGDHHIDKIEVAERGGVLFTGFDDRNNDDPYTFDVKFAWVPRSRFSTEGTITRIVDGTAVDRRTDVPAGQKVITEFGINYSEGDHHARTFGVETNTDAITVSFGDKNPADSGSWGYRVQFAVLR